MEVKLCRHPAPAIFVIMHDNVLKITGTEVGRLT
jgi:hypothetical protein